MRVAYCDVDRRTEDVSSVRVVLEEAVNDPPTEEGPGRPETSATLDLCGECRDALTQSPAAFLDRYKRPRRRTPGA